MTRRQLISWLMIVSSVIAVSMLAGFGEMGRWALLVTCFVAMVVASFTAPEYFAWREPPEG